MENTGREVWRISLGGNTKSAPISFKVGGRQVIAMAAGRALFVSHPTRNRSLLPPQTTRTPSRLDHKQHDLHAVLGR
jgi:hypothetical protein